MTTIFYNNRNPFSGIAPTPLISRREERISFGEYWGTKEVVTLFGQITGRCQTFAQKIAAQNFLISGFSKDFQQFYIEENGVLIFSKPLTQIDKISFPDNNYSSSVIPFEISLSCYPSGYFSGQYGVLNPVNEFTFEEGNDGIITINHNVSAKGFNTSAGNNNSLINAQSWVNTKTGWSNQVLPAFISTGNFYPCLISVAENPNRLDGSYSIKEVYTTDPCQTGAGILKFTTEYNFDLERGISEMSLAGNIEGCKNGNLQSIRNRYASFDAFGEALTTYWKITNITDLNFQPLTKGVSENPTSLKLSFSYLWDNDKSPKTFFDYVVNFSYDYESDIITASIDGDLKSKELIENRWNILLQVADNIDLYSIILPYYLEYAASVNPAFVSFPLNQNIISKRRSENKFSSKISLGATYSNSNVPSDGLKDFDYTISFSPSLESYLSQPVLNGFGQYIVYDMGFATRARCELQVRAVGSDSQTAQEVESYVKNQIGFLQAQYFAGSRKHLESQTISKSNESFNKRIEGRAIFTAEQSIFLF